MYLDILHEQTCFIAGDLNENCFVDLNDFAILARAWLSSGGDDNWNPDCDISEPNDNVIDAKDLEILTNNWLEYSNDPAHFLPEGFEFYSGSNPLEDTWEPTGATEGWYSLSFEPFIHSGNKALEIWADNTYSPHYCGVSRTGAAEDYTLGDTAASLSLWYRGKPSIDEIYVKLIDDTDEEAVVKYSDAWDISDLEIEQWQQWTIELHYFTDDNPSFDMTQVKTLEIGVGDCVSPRPVGVGQVYFDDIQLTLP